MKKAFSAAALLCSIAINAAHRDLSISSKKALLQKRSELLDARIKEAYREKAKISSKELARTPALAARLAHLTKEIMRLEEEKNITKNSGNALPVH